MTSQIELSIIAGKCCDILQKKEVELYDMLIERLYVTPGAGGLSVTMMKMDEELMKYYDRSAESPFFKVGERSGSQ